MKKGNNITSAIVIGLTFMLRIANAQAQWNTTTGNNVTSSGIYLGTNGSSTQSLKLKTTETGSNALPIDFWTNNIWQMTLRTDGNLNMVDPATGFWIDGEPVLWHNGNTSNLYVGVGAGNAASTGTSNTYVGQNAGNSNTGGSANTFIGESAGLVNTSGQLNVFVGESAGNDNTTGFQNVFIGSQAGEGITTGRDNTFIGEAARSNTANSINRTAIGAFAQSDADNTVILGSVAGVNGAANNVNVGVGTTVPATRLHLHSNASAPTAPVFARFSNPNTVQLNGNEGLEVGIDAAGTGFLRHMTSTNNLPIEVWTGNLPTAVFTHRNFFNSPGIQGTGLRIVDPDVNPGGDLDLWTSTSNQTHIVWGPNGRIFGRNDRFEIQADNTEGLWFNVVNSGTGTFFNQVGQETGRIGSNTFWRIGANPGNANAANTLEIDQGTAGNSGLRFTRLPNSTVPIANPSNGVLSVNNNGDVIWVSAGGNVSACSTGVANYVTKWCSTTNQIQNSIIFDNGTTVGISTGSLPSIAAKLHVENNASRWIGTFSSTTGGTGSSAIGVVGASRGATRANIGVIGEAAHPVSFLSILDILGIFGPAHNVGVVGRAQGATINFGGIFEADECPSARRNYGIYAAARRICNNANQMPNSAAGYFNGYGYFTEGISSTSDQFLKDSIIEYRNALSAIEKLRAKRYIFKNDSFPSMNLPQGGQIGFIAQNVDTVLPQLVTEVVHPAFYDTSGTMIYDTIAYKALNYTGLIPIAIRGIQELKAITDSLGLHKAQVCSLPTDSNRLSKWSNTTGRLCSSLIYDDGTRVGISATHPDSKLYVENIDTSQKVIGVFGSAKGGEERNAGIEGRATGYVSEGFNVGVSGEADSSDMANAGVIGYVNYEAETPINVGVVGMAGSSENQNIGGYFEVDHKKTDYGIYAVNSGGGLAGYFDGDVEVTGSIYSSSDAALKQNVQNVAATDALAKLLQLQPRSYEFSDSNAVEINLPQGRQYGFLAQEVEQILPGLVTEVTHPQRLDNTGHPVGAKMDYKAINYTGLIPLLVSAVKDQQTKIDSLQQVIDTRLSAIEQRLNNCCERGALPTDGAFKDQPTTTVVELTNLQAIVLEQNVPNPFAEQTTINYFIPEGSGAAQVVFFDMLGRTIKTVDAKSGYGSLTVFASNLSTGQYSYALLIDGKQAASKSMIKTK